jgi:putative membrane protein
MTAGGLWRRLWPPLPVWPKLDAAVAAVAAYTLAATLVHRHWPLDVPDWGAAAAGLNALILGVLLGFRNAQAYDRWWEGRKLWGALVNDCRNLAAKAAALPGLAPADRAALRGLIAGFPPALARHLRNPQSPHEPQRQAAALFALLRGWRDAGRLTEIDLVLLDPHARAWLDIAGACERIRNSPLPLSYRSLLRHGLVLHLAATPWLIVERSGWWAIPAASLLAYFLLGIEFTAASIENPFGDDRDDLPLDAIAAGIAQCVDETLAAGASP